MNKKIPNDSLDVLVEAKAAVKKLTSHYGERDWYADPKISAVIRSATQLFVDLEVALYDIKKDLPSGQELGQDYACTFGVPQTPETVFISGEKLRSMEEVPLQGEIKFKPKRKEKYKMTGVYFRVKRNGKWVNKEIEYLTKEEREELLQGWSKEELMRTIHLLCNSLDYITEETD